ncbi:MAG: hypothetical protein KatS3mg112_1929 [Thermogutta sp.]|nr:MAG: hypothetical protein KatS3mg112_1929 [Thermogutta sp.]
MENSTPNALHTSMHVYPCYPGGGISRAASGVFECRSSLHGKEFCRFLPRRARCTQYAPTTPVISTNSNHPG